MHHEFKKTVKILIDLFREDKASTCIDLERHLGSFGYFQLTCSNHCKCDLT